MGSMAATALVQPPRPTAPSNRPQLVPIGMNSEFPRAPAQSLDHGSQQVMPLKSPTSSHAVCTEYEQSHGQ
ncbi:hypothetical protein EKO04_007378 [Ascochyta lentis]|uniref:Uncharacterized protein n=1 Tax=Ascochyta lentis TaxID=205686 RepID=A0A8H7J1A6_9PLEO|nr:hypothetical protein EKO04_007378 [Ascochyta lentis]